MSNSSPKVPEIAQDAMILQTFGVQVLGNEVKVSVRGRWSLINLYSVKGW